MLAQQKPRQFSQVSASYSSHHGTPYQSPPTIGSQPNGLPPGQQSRKRSFQEDYTYDYPALQQMQAHATNGSQIPVELTPHGQHAQLQAGAVSYQYQPQRSSSAQSHSHASTPQQTYAYQQQQQQQTVHHHHRLPNQQPPNKLQRTSSFGRETPEDDEHGPPSVVGQPGMPEPAPRPKGPKLKFTPEDDALLVELKETKNLTWKQIADFFPGRSSGTLQVRYCTKLKAKTTIWTDDMVQRLHTAMQEYEADRWRVISGKVGNGFSATACKEKAMELDAPDMEDTEYVRHDSTTATNLLQDPSTTTARETLLHQQEASPRPPINAF
ncbi:Putative SANT/Myb domain, Homeobox-like domain superfamily protein [Septoria linicola]|uniref:SANT/Myb domain, Homeobox-like domain superfamily protein n=1 Tax=Septoria linicola TaxID=215465 RepID=A0A9Q9EGU4_9PEZI|nr:putative SANT/Myb domain, Homeobox-like domain superfamily protein [Septoria linicola]USW49202.1 Putative SANT/Myb domain, Homeobox-like domain superfamily protein [Septoria linicola]